MPRKYKGKLTISRSNSSGSRDNTIEIRVGDESSSVEFISIEVSPEQMMLALTGFSYQPCSFELRDVGLVGKVREHKTEVVFVPDGPWETRKERATDAVKALEVDGWKGRVEDAMNCNKLVDGGRRAEEKGAKYRVVYVRHVDAPEAAEAPVREGGAA